jgi:hypothetical protein
MKPKRKPGAGRKPRGPFTKNTAVLTVRMPDDLRRQLKGAADKKGWSLTQELLWRVRSSYNRQREEERRPPATRALCFLLCEITERVGFPNISKWHRSRFAFRAFRLALAQLLERLEPPGEIKYPQGYKRLSEVLRAHQQGSAADRFDAQCKTPEALADYLSEYLMDRILHPRPGFEVALRKFRDHPEAGSLIEDLLNTMYGIADVRRDLGIQVGEPRETW